MRRLVSAVAAVLLGGLLWSASDAHACGMVVRPPPLVRIPASQANEQNMRWAYGAGGGYVDVVRFHLPSPDDVIFYGTATGLGEVVELVSLTRSNRRETQVHESRRPAWRFTVEDVVHGQRLGSAVVILESGSNCDVGYRLGERQLVRARWNAGYLRSTRDPYMAVGFDPARPPAPPAVFNPTPPSIEGFVPGG